jgi:hypothetical protein
MNLQPKPKRSLVHKELHLLRLDWHLRTKAGANF